MTRGPVRDKRVRGLDLVRRQLRPVEMLVEITIFRERLISGCSVQGETRGGTRQGVSVDLQFQLL